MGEGDWTERPDATLSSVPAGAPGSGGDDPVAPRTFTRLMEAGPVAGALCDPSPAARRAPDGTPPGGMVSLTPKQQRFVEEYAVDLNATQAYIRAGYSAKGAAQSAAALLRNPKIVDTLVAAAAERSERLGIEADLVLQRLAAVAFADVRDLVSWTARTVTVKPSEELTPAQAASVAEVRRRVTQYGDEVTLKTRDSLKALELLGRHLGMFRPEVMIDSSTAVQGDVYWTRDPASDLRMA